MEWISVTDNRKRPRGNVLWYHPPVNKRYPLGEYYRVASHDLTTRPATHWMPLPPPPKEAENGRA